MKRYILKAGILMLSALPMACTGNYLNINTNPYQVSKDDMATDGYDIGATLAAISSTVVSTDINTCQFTDCLLGGPMGGYYSTTGGFEKTIDNFNATDDWTRVFLASDRIIPTLFSNLRELENLTDDPMTLAIAKVVKVAAMSRVTDTYGPIPYSKIGVGGQIAVEYDSQEMVYDRMFEELDEAISTLTENQLNRISPKADPVYDGTAVKWCKLANSLKLRLAMRIVYADQAKAQKYAEEAVSHEIGVFTSNADNAALQAKAFGDKGNPIYTAVKYNQPSGANTGGDTHVAADIVHYMNCYEDPRRAKYFVPSMFDNVDYVGIRVTVVKPSLMSVGYKYSGVNVSPADPVQWMNAAEVAFLKAEASAVFGFNMGGSAEEFYNEGIRLSFSQWGVSGADSYLANDELKLGAYQDPGNSSNSYSTPLTDVTIKWDEAADVEKKQERIIIQKWIANFNLGNEAWADHRRTGYPVFFPADGEGNKCDKGEVDPVLGARRMPYPISERSNNGLNLDFAISNYLKGKDQYATRLWWDCKPGLGK